ncbi:hypothetical protein [Paenibacillus piri]|uniref:Uncharacterized protein n=1 Tax=Paenibacillus piri TaxID=2547395 RepID=A0A4R5KXT5_9BACL|nr:hypothetical protein [Paenibacillus piri]TDG00864.1 hypothetical protein E1757_04440 [Paenibacillus piri]
MLSKGLEDQLVERFPWTADTAIFVDAGWYQLIWNMFEELEPFRVNLEVREINEKYGAMIIDYREKEECPTEVTTIIRKYVLLSDKTCEVCGADGRIRVLKGWQTAYCDPCFKSAQDEHLKRLAELKARDIENFNGLCFTCSSTGTLRELGNEVRRGYCDPCYEKHLLDQEFLNFRGGLFWKDQEQLRQEILQRFSWAEVKNDNGNGKGYLAPFFCNKGWFLLIWRMLSEIEELFKEKNLPIDVHINEVSEKYGEMRVWVSSDIIPDLVQGIVDKYEKLSRETCKECGEKGSNQNVKSAPYCEPHLISELNRMV